MTTLTQKKPSYLASRTALALGALVLTASMRADDWPQWRGPNRDGVSVETGWTKTWPADGPKQLWKASVGIGYGSMSVRAGKLFVMGNTADNDTVYALDAETGKVLWTHEYPCVAKDPNGYPGTRCTPTTDGTTVYTLGRQGQLFALDAAKGTVKWSKDYKTDFSAKVPVWGFATSPLVEGNLLIVETGAAGASIVALDKTTGKVVWQAGDDAAGYSSPVAFERQGKREVVALTAVGLVGRDVKDGKELWRYPWKTSWDVNAATPLVIGTQVFVSSGYNTGCALVDVAANPPKELWKNKSMRNHVNSCVVSKGLLFGFDESDLKCLDLATGDVKWSEKKYGKGAVELADGKLLLYSEKAGLGVAEVTADGYKELAFATVIPAKDAPPNTQSDSWASPTLANGRIYCRKLDDLVCLDVKGK